MDLTATIITTAKAAHVSGALLLAICAHESQDFTKNLAPHDHGSPSYGFCQVKEATARMLGFKGATDDLMKPEVNVFYAAKYLSYQQGRYGDDDWCTLVASYNAGSFNESTRAPGYPKNLKYVRLVQHHLDADLKPRLQCGPSQVASKEWN